MAKYFQLAALQEQVLALSADVAAVRRDLASVAPVMQQLLEAAVDDQRMLKAAAEGLEAAYRRMAELEAAATGRLSAKYATVAEVMQDIVGQWFLQRGTDQFGAILGNTPEEVVASVLKAVRAVVGQPPGLDRGATLFESLMASRQSFWTLVYPRYVERELTRRDMRSLIRLGLEYTRGNYKGVMQLFNMNAEDQSEYKRFMNLLHKQGWYFPFKPFRRPSSHPAA